MIDERIRSDLVVERAMWNHRLKAWILHKSFFSTFFATSLTEIVTEEEINSERVVRRTAESETQKLLWC